MLDFVDKYPDLQETPAQFQERCGQIALACFWNEQRVPRLPKLRGIWPWYEAGTDGAAEEVFQSRARQ
jgi:hypothetical protein